MNKRYFIITYDIQDNRTRQKVGETLLDAGLQRVQKSVFEGELTHIVLGKLQHQLKKFIGKSDSILYYPLCGNCRQKMKYQGKLPTG